MAAAQSMGEIVVKVERSRVVKPSTKTEASNMYLSTCDLVCRTYPYINRVFFYDLSGEQVAGKSEYEAIVSSLEEGLSKTLVSFYPLAGRLSEDEDGRLQIVCNDAGVELIETSLSPDVPLSVFQQDGFQYSPLYWKLCCKSDLLRSDFPKEPLLAVQITALEGGLAVGVSMSHILADAQSFYDFMRCWSEMCKNGSMSLPPKHMRTALSVKAMFREEAHLTKTQDQGQFPIIATQAQSEELRRPKPGLAQRYFNFSIQMLQHLKATANAGVSAEIPSKDASAVPGNQPARNGSRALFTTFEAFCAHWWQSIIKARNLDPEQLVCLLIPVNCRQRFLELPKSFFGNSLDGALIKCKSAELCALTLSEVTGKIHEAIIAATEDRFKKYIKEAEANKGAVFHFDRTELYHIMDSPQFPMYSTDFGFGAPQAIRAEGSRYGCEVQIIPARPGLTGFDFFCGLDPPSMQRLEQDASFLPNSS